MKSLVTGGAGFIGSHVAQHLIAAGHDVVILDDLSGGHRDNIPPTAAFIEGSILDDKLLNATFGACQFDYVFHLAAYAAEGLSHFIKRFNHSNNLIGSVNLINAAVNHGVKCFVFTSSIAVYGEGQTPFKEEDVPQPEDSYGISKLAVEQELRASFKMFGLPYIIFRPHNVFGPHQNIGDKYRNVVGIFMNQLMQGKPMTIFGDGSQERAFSYIYDVAPTIANSVTAPEAWNHTFNIGADTPCTVKHLAELVAVAMGKDVHIKYLPPRQEAHTAFADHRKLKQFFDCQHTPLVLGLNEMARWAWRHGARVSEPFHNIEIQKNLPPSWL